MISCLQHIAATVFVVCFAVVLISGCNERANPERAVNSESRLDLQRQIDEVKARYPHVEVGEVVTPTERPGEALVVFGGIRNASEASSVFQRLLRPWGVLYVQKEGGDFGWTRADPNVETLQAFWYWDSCSEGAKMYVYIAVP